MFINLIYRRRLGPKQFRGAGIRKNVGNRQTGVQQGIAKVNPQRAQGPTTSFTVTGVSNMKGFDARQKLAKNKQQSPVKDAREKIVQNSKFVDARVRIQSKKAQNVDARSKIDSAKAKKVDAREMIKARQGGPQQVSPGASSGNQVSQVTVTGMGRVMTSVGAGGVVATSDGQLFKTVRTGPTLTTTIPQLLMRTVSVIQIE